MTQRSKLSHDCSHCLDYIKGLCPSDCYYAEATEDLTGRTDLWYKPLSWSHFMGSEACIKYVKEQKEMLYTKRQMEEEVSRRLHEERTTEEIFKSIHDIRKIVAEHENRIEDLICQMQELKGKQKNG